MLDDWPLSNEEKDIIGNYGAEITTLIEFFESELK